MLLSDPTPLITVPVIPVVTIERSTDAVPLARALLAGGLNVVEITLRTPAAMDAVRAIIAEVDDIIVGVGTVTKLLDIAHAVEAGADFLVSPGTPAALVQALADAPVPVLPGCATVAEAMMLAAFGFPVLKLFPAEAAGGPNWLKAVAEPLPQIRFCPTGGINGTNAPAYLALGNVLAVGGSWVAPAEAIASGDFAGITARAPALPRRCAHDALASRLSAGSDAAPSSAAPVRLSTEAPITRRPRKAFDWSSATIAVAVVVSAAVVYWRDGQARFLEILFADLSLFVDILPKVLAACLIAAFVAVLMPRETVLRWVGAESGIAGILIATLAGMICPGGPITIFPIAAAFVAIGADTGAAIAFITSWTLLGYARILVWELPFFGGEFVIWRTIISLPLPIVAGLLARLLADLARKRNGGGGG